MGDWLHATTIPESTPAGRRTPSPSELAERFCTEQVILGSLAIVAILPGLTENGGWHRAVWAQFFDSVRIYRPELAPGPCNAAAVLRREKICFGNARLRGCT